MESQRSPTLRASLLTMYHRYFGLKEVPFSIAVNPRYLFMSTRHRDALAHLIYGVGEGGGFILLTGEVGTGKTTINRSLLEQLPDNTDIALILNPALNAVELLATVCDELHISYEREDQNSLKILSDKLHHFLLANYAKGRNTVLLIDEAQHLKFDVLEQVRLLTNLETNTKKLLQIILVGQPELRTLLNKPELRQLAQRITARYQLKPLNLQETRDYIRHRLQVAGLPGNQTLFPDAIIKKLHRTSRGVPRIINVLCDRMLLGCYGKNKAIVDKAMLKQATLEVMGEEEDIQLATVSYKWTIAAGLGALLIGSVIAWQWPLSTSSSVAVATPEPGQQVAAFSSQQSPPIGMASPAPASNSPWFTTQQTAIEELFTAHNWTLENRVNSCENNTEAGLRCEKFSVKSWPELQSYNRPAVLTLITKAKTLRYATLLGINNDLALLSVDGKPTEFPLQTLGKMWTGEFLFFWQAPGVFTGPITLNDRGAGVSWLSDQFAEMDKQPTGLADDVFNMALMRRLKIFQKTHQLAADGTAGLKTLLKLNEQLKPDITPVLTVTTDKATPIATPPPANNPMPLSEEG